jgi:hypothetical protein
LATNTYTLTRQKKQTNSSFVTLTPEQASRKSKLLSGFIAARWGSHSPKLYETINQELLEAYEEFIDPYIRTDLPVPEYNPAILAISKTKVCKSCLEEKALDQFYIHTRTKDGRRPHCKECMRDQDKARRSPVPCNFPGGARGPCPKRLPL